MTGRIMRTLHLVFGVSCTLALLMYGVSSVQMAHGTFSWRQIDDIRIAVPAEASPSPRALARHLAGDRGLVGELTAVAQTRNGFRFQLVRPGRIHDVTWDSGSSEARVRTRDAGVIGTLNRLHHANGLWHDDPVANLWGALAGLVSILLLGLGVTGLWLWFRKYEERVVGGAVLAVGLIVGLGLSVAMRLQP